MITRRTLVFFVGVGNDALNRRNVERRRQIIYYRIEQRLNAAIAIRRAARDGRHLAIDRRLANDGFDFILGDGVAAEIFFHEVVVLLGASLQKFIAILLGDFSQVVGNVDFGGFLPEIVVIDNRVHLDQIDDAREFVLGADRQLDRDGVGVQAVAHHLYHIKKVRSGYIHFVDISHPWDIVSFRLAPNGFGLRLDTAARRQNRHRPVEHSQRTLDFDGKIDVPGRVDDVDPMILPMTGCRRRRDRNAALLLLHHPIHSRGAVVDFADLMSDAGVEQNALGGGGFAGVDVRHYTYVASLFE